MKMNLFMTNVFAVVLITILAACQKENIDDVPQRVNGVHDIIPLPNRIDFYDKVRYIKKTNNSKVDNVIKLTKADTDVIAKIVIGVEHMRTLYKHVNKAYSKDSLAYQRRVLRHAINVIACLSLKNNYPELYK